MSDKKGSKPGWIDGKKHRYVKPWILLILSHKPSYGYGIVEQLGQLNPEEEVPDLAAIYRHLRKMEEEKLVISQWETEGGGPAKRIYEVTPQGIQMIHEASIQLERKKKALENFIDIYHQFFEDK